MRMYNKLPTYVYIKNKKYKINTDFRIFISFEEEMAEQVDVEKVIIKTLRKFYPAFFEILNCGLIEEAINKFIWFYCRGKEKQQNNNRSSEMKKRGRIFSYKYDQDLIWSAFYDKGIDLTVSKIHWWKFKAIFDSLPSECEFCKVIGYRCYDGKDEDMLHLKEEYSLPLTNYEINEKERQNRIYEQLKEFERK